jgi:riboflavin kinase / FMN adenylyltransferase
MNVYNGLDALQEPFRRSTVAIGTFDGVHLGHQAVIQTATEDARQNNRRAVVFTFDRHPAELLAPDRVPGYLTTPAQRIPLIAAQGTEELVIVHFDSALAGLTAEEFVRMILKERLGAEAIVIGDDFHFGKNRSGNAEYLHSVQESFGFQLSVHAPVLLDGVPVHSSQIRALIREGKVSDAERLLGHPFLLSGRVVQGQQLGRTLGYPTANLALTVNQVVPADGIYAVEAILDDGRTFGGACSIGSRPTIAGAGRSIETYLFDFNGDIYGRGMELRFLHYLRPEVKFDSLDALVLQMAQDVKQARQIYSG